MRMGTFQWTSGFKTGGFSCHPGLQRIEWGEESAMSPEQKERLYTLMREMYDKLGDDIDDLVILAEINEQSRFALDRIWAEERLSRTLD
jgi:hypothetical protein